MDSAAERRERFARSLVSGESGFPGRFGQSGTIGAVPAQPSAATGADSGDVALSGPDAVAGAVAVTGAARLDATIRFAAAAGLEVIPTCCFSCNSACEVLAFRDNATGRIVKIEGDPSSPVTGGIACAKGLAAVDLLYNPARLKKPLRRTSPRGAPPEWKEISWDAALDEIAARILACRESDGAKSVAFLEGTRRGWSRVFSRLANAFGSPNHGAAGWAQCLWPRLVDCKVTLG
ncbi:MAG: molybdopterin-dependent oxidoreductase, partial [Rectinemataceae bacterium]|nr:molybdopterin-dependent oxidoreductase [Rectinemataceae bacterium]